jgi:uncharacterized protein YktB (UPF0637 family)
VERNAETKAKLLLTDVLTAAFAVSRAHPHYRLVDYNCYYFVHQTYGLLLDLSKEKGDAYKFLEVKHAGRNAGESALPTRFRPYSKDIAEGDKPDIRQCHEGAIETMASRMAGIKVGDNLYLPHYGIRLTIFLN